MDISNSKVCTPAALFLLLTPGFILQLPDTTKLFTMKTSLNSVMFHALVFMIVYRLVAKMMNVVFTQADLIVPTILFVLLSPGVILTVPQGKTGFIRTGETNIEAMLSHTLIFAVVFALLRRTFPQYY